MTVTIHPSAVNGIIHCPPSKSLMLRACAAALLHRGVTIIHNPGNSDDEKAALKVIAQLGARIQDLSPDAITVESNGVFPVTDLLTCGESGLLVRMFTPIAALSPLPITLTGSGTLLTRPMDLLDAVLPRLGVQIHSNGGLLPLQVKGPLVPTSVTMDGSMSSQYLTGLLMALSAVVTEPVTITVQNLTSRPYIDLTLEVLRDFGCRVHHHDYRIFTVSRPLPPTNPVTYTVEGDWSGAACMLVAGAVSGSVAVEGLTIASSQADKAILQPLRDSGAVVQVEANHVMVSRPPNHLLQSFCFDATECPDLFPPLVALACHCEGMSRIKGIQRLVHKESNRAQSLQEEFGKMGVLITWEGDWMQVHGAFSLKGASIHSHHDHRVVMACSVAALRAAASVEIAEADAVNKSYPSFFRHLSQLGVSLSLKATRADE